MKASIKFIPPPLSKWRVQTLINFTRELTLHASENTAKTILLCPSMDISDIQTKFMIIDYAIYLSFEFNQGDTQLRRFSENSLLEKGSLGKQLKYQEIKVHRILNYIGTV